MFPLRVKLLRGFTLLEALVAIVIASTVLVSLYGMLNQNIGLQIRAKQSIGNASLMQSIQAAMHDINPGKESEGSFQVGDMKVNWSSSELSQQRRNLINASQPGSYQLALYEIRFSVSDGLRRVKVPPMRKVGFIKLGERAE